MDNICIQNECTDIKTGKNYCRLHLTAKTNSQKAYKKKIKIECFTHYGGAICACCRENNIIFLVLDHIDGKGNQERIKFGGTVHWGGHNIYTRLRVLGYPSGYQVLCCNCNWGKRMNNNICPHKEKSAQN